jgi:hypothetical protein
MKGKQTSYYQKIYFIIFKNSRKRSSAVVTNDTDRRNSHRSRSRSPHPSLTNLLNKTSSSSRKHHSSNISDDSKTSLHSLSSTFPNFDPLTLSMIERQRLSAAYASLFASASQANQFFPTNIDPTLFRNNKSSNLFPNLDSSAMTAALIQREHFLNSIRLSQQQQHEQIIGRESRTTGNNNATQIHKASKTNKAISPTSISSTSSSKKIKHIKREEQSLSPSTQNHDLTSKDESVPSTSATT